MKHLTNEPIGEDWYDGKAQTALAKRIVAEIKTPSTFMGPDGTAWEHTVVMALEGPWGCGKSNVLKMVENEIGHTLVANKENKAEAVFVNYDLWMHRQDLSRKSILESIVAELVDDKKVLPEVFKSELMELTGERVRGSIKETPRIGWTSWVFIGINVLLVALSVWNSIRKDLFNWELTSMQVVFGLIVIGICRFIESEYRKLKDYSFQTFRHVDEPSAKDFIDYLGKVANALSDPEDPENHKKVILVFDNLDRLHDEEIQKFWTATHVLFAERRTHRPRNVQVIIPYDRARMRETFGSSQAGDEYIRKVIDKVFVMPAVIMTDWSRFMLERMKVVFEGFDDQQLLEAVRVFDWLHRPDDLTPRAMISFVNDMVSVYEGLRYDGDEKVTNPIPLSIVALYVMGWRRSAIADKIDNAELLIVGGAFIPDECKVARTWYLGDLNHSTQLAAVVYQLPEKQAAAILSYQRVGASLDGNISLQGICRQPEFHQVFSSVIKHVKQFEMVPQALATIDTPDAQKYWDEYYDVKKDEIVMAHGSFPIITKGEALLFANISKWQEYYMKLEDHLQKNAKGMFNENLQVQFAEAVEKALNTAGRTLVGHFARKPLSVDGYLKLLNVARERFPLMNATCDLDDLDSYVARGFERDKECYGLQYLSKSILDKLPHTRVALSGIVSDIRVADEVKNMAAKVYQRFLGE